MSRYKPIAQDAYDKLAEEYADQVESRPYNAYLEQPAMMDLLPEVSGKRVLDAGCGPGHYSEWLVERDAEVVGVDASPEMVKQAKKRLGDAAEIRRADLREPLDFADDEFDLVMSPLTLHYIEDWQRLFAEFARVLRPGGTFACSVHHPLADYIRFDLDQYFDVEQMSMFWESFDGEVEVPTYRRSLQDTLNPLLDAGFRLEEVVEPTPTEEFKEHDAEAYEELCRRPSFLCLRARFEPREYESSRSEDNRSTDS